MSTPAKASEEGAGGSWSKTEEKFRACKSCRALSGGGLMISGYHVFKEAQKVMRLGGPTSVGTVIQITFAASLAALGVIIIADPVGKMEKKI